jgi:hypothetical protein
VFGEEEDKDEELQEGEEEYEELEEEEDLQFLVVGNRDCR